LLESLHVQPQPRRQRLLEDDVGHQVAAVRQHQHEDPRLAQHLLPRAQQLPDVAEVHLRHLAGRSHHGDGDLLGPHALRLAQLPHHAFHGRVARREALYLQPQPVVDGARAQPLPEQGLHALLPGHQRRGLLRWQLRRQVRLHQRLERLQLGHLVGRAL